MKRILWKITKWFLGITFGLFLLISLLLYVYKDDIINAVVGEINKQLVVPVEVSEIDLAFWGSFPNISIDLNKVHIRDAYADSLKHRGTLLYTERIRLKFNPLDLWNENYHLKAIELSPGKLNIKINKKGQANYNIFKSDTSATKEEFNMKLQEITLSDFGFSFRNELTSQFYKTRFKESTFAGDFAASKYTFEAVGSAMVNKAKSGEITLLARKTLDFDLKIMVDTEKGTINLPNEAITVAGLPFSIQGVVDADSLHFQVASRNIQLTDLVNKFSLSAAEDVKKFKGEGQIDFNLDINGALETEDPTTIVCHFGVENGSLTEPYQGLKISDIQVDGKYSNEGGSEEEFLELRKLHFRTAGGPFNGDIRISEFANPRVEGKAGGNIDLNVANAIFHFPEVEKIRGAVSVNTDFAIQSQTETGAVDVVRCDGDVDLRGIFLKLKDDKRQFENISGSIFLRGDQAGIDQASMKVGQTDLSIDGMFSNIYNYFKGTGKLQTQVDIQSNFIRIEDLGTTTKAEKIKGDAVFALPEDINGNVRLSVGGLQYDKHRFSNIVSNMQIQGRRLHFSQLSLVNAEALISGALIIEEKNPNIFNITAQIASNNIKFKPVFREWDNFEQSVITDQQISGRAEANLYFNAPFDLDGGINLKAIKAQLDLKVFDGQLKNVSAFTDIIKSLKGTAGKLVMGKNNIAFLEKKLENIQFATLENSIIIHDGVIDIPKMQIKSSALDMDVAGKHTFDNVIDYRFAFRFRDLKTENRDSEFGIVVDDGTGIKVFMRMHGTLENPIIEWDKTSSKEQAKQNREEAKQEAKSILKSEFGLFKNDTSVKTYVPKDLPKEDLKIKFGPATKEEFKEEQEKQKKDSKLKNTLQKWKQQQEGNEEGFKVGKGGGK